MQTVTPQPIDAGNLQLLEERRRVRAAAPEQRERIAELGFALLSLAGAVALPLISGPPGAFSTPLALAFVVAYAIVARVAFHLGDGYIVPTQLVFVPMLLLVPPSLVPLLVTVAALGSNATRRGWAPQRAIFAITDAAFAFAPAVVLLALGARTPTWSLWPVYAAALAAQFGADAVREVVRSWL